MRRKNINNNLLLGFIRVKSIKMSFTHIIHEIEYVDCIILILFIYNTQAPVE